MAITTSIDPNLAVTVLCGGTGAERDVSLISGAAVMAALREAGWNAQTLDISGMPDEIRNIHCDAAFLALHGEFGEDGTIQAILEETGLPFTGSGSAASSLGMDKHRSKQAFRAVNIPTPLWAITDTAELNMESLHKKGLTLPLVVKPVCRGSSVATTIVRKSEDIPEAVHAALKVDTAAMIEQCIEGREFTVGMLDNEMLPIIELQPKREFYDYDAKYNDDDTGYLCPAPLSEQQTTEMQTLAHHVCTTLGVEHFGRVDIMLSTDGPAVLEVNTIPGFTSHSLLPMAANAAGIPFPELTSRILCLGIARAKKQGKETPKFGK